MRRLRDRGLSLGTGWERIAPESLTQHHSWNVHRNISRWDQYGSTRSSFSRLHKPWIPARFLNDGRDQESNQNR